MRSGGSFPLSAGRYRAYTGQTLEEWLGYGWLEAIHPDDRAFAEQQRREAMAARRVVDAEFRLRAPNGGWRWTNVRAAPVLDAQGHIKKWAAVNIDIDARKRAESALRESEEKYRDLFESMDEAHAVVEVIKDAEGRWADFRFLDVNCAFLVHTTMPWPVGKTATELLGSPNPRWTELYGQALDTGQPLRVEEPEATLGLIFDLNIFSLDRERNRVAVLFTNITERKTAEAALRESEERQAILLKLSDAARSATDNSQILKEASRLVGQHLGGGLGCDRARALRRRATRERGTLPPVRQGFIGRAVDQGRPDPEDGVRQFGDRDDLRRRMRGFVRWDRGMVIADSAGGPHRCAG
ncbi:PAS domain-containing protein (plasmid) [Novosphingobium sp. BL-8A]|uniref:PAS domain-containing protein n=1 Tax=Novosphingobium sp. BL-8A TaxID=3127639 RepID=UPI0037583E55